MGILLSSVLYGLSVGQKTFYHLKLDVLQNFHLYNFKNLNTYIHLLIKIFVRIKNKINYLKNFKFYLIFLFNFKKLITFLFKI